ncbi:hypothetical protein HanRHA438_Chr12g0550761 [Helianthus annuus]|nr:hypothetical protein HanRHA438_Chr12g0550761 [Helianthus annuus]
MIHASALCYVVIFKQRIRSCYGVTKGRGRTKTLIGLNSSN